VAAGRRASQPGGMAAHRRQAPRDRRVPQTRHRDEKYAVLARDLGEDGEAGRDDVLWDPDQLDDDTLALMSVRQRTGAGGADRKLAAVDR
jgi:hypothetical protein